MGLASESGGTTLTLGHWRVALVGPPAVVRPLAAVLSSVAVPEREMPSLGVVIARDRRALGTVGVIEAWQVILPTRGWLPLLVGHVVGAATSALRELLFVHAAAVEFGGRGYLLVGPPGAGKTAITALLVGRGAGYLSDEVALLDPGTGLVHPFTLPLAVKPPTARAVDVFPPAREVASEGGVRYLLPSRVASGPVPLEAVLLLDPRSTHGPAVLERAETLLALSRHPSSFRYESRLAAAFTGFVGLLRRARCLRIGSASPARAAALVAALGEVGAVDGAARPVGDG
ncbi:MAG: hypothetical protein QN117_05990 [Armatimonadota bacterium]|nr:hypothetical protein [Armatimonadota bacterium]MDR7452679.1 hypothetical protein [Armatimonadota bacterium]MDR7466715.1 hypothetical protein [Armatimonadota bacterium]MDR7492811.1 hypothetical protein [Armatimonadota bacterium]MDR7498587.1 hypothetical protein [Armatimonadota bacterium]